MDFTSHVGSAMAHGSADYCACSGQNSVRGLVRMGPCPMLVERQQCTTKLAADGAAVAGKILDVVALHVAEHEVAATMTIVTVQATPVLAHRTAEHAQFNTWNGDKCRETYRENADFR